MLYPIDKLLYMALYGAIPLREHIVSGAGM